MADWGISPLGNLAQFEVPAFRTGEGLAAIMALKQRQAEHAQQLGASIGGSVADAMQQRKKDEMYNVLMDQYSKEYGIANPFAGQGEQGFMAAKELIKMQQSTQDQSLQARMAEARISRIGRASTGGGGGGTVDVPTGLNIQTDPATGIQFIRGPRGGTTILKRPGTAAAAGGAEGTANAKDSEYFKLLKRQGEIEGEGIPGEAPSRELQAINMRIAQIQGARQPPPPKEIAEPQWSFKTQTPQVEKGATMPKTQIAEGYGVTLPAGSKRTILGVPHVWDGMKWVPE